MDGNAYQSYSSPADRNNYPVHYSQQETFDRLMDSVYKSRTEDIQLGQYPMKMSVEDVHIVNGAIEIRARIAPKPDIHLENSAYADPYHQPLYQSQPSYQLPYQAQYQYPYPSPYQSQPQYTYPHQFPAPYYYQYPPTNVVGSIANAINQLASTRYLLRR